MVVERHPVLAMAYRVHHLEIDLERDEHKLEDFLNRLEGEVVAIVPNVRRTSLGQIYGLSRKIDFLLVVERTD